MLSRQAEGLSIQCQVCIWLALFPIKSLIHTPFLLPPDVQHSSQFGNQPLVTLDFPVPLQQRVINALKADPKSVDLRAQTPYFYSLGARILDLFEDEDVVDVLIDVGSFPHLAC